MKIAFFGDSLTHGLPGSSYLKVLGETFPQYTLLNFGRGNDTVSSLYRRLSRMRVAHPLDIAFLWIGVNDVVGDLPWSYRIVNSVLGQHHAKDLAQFRAAYQANLDLLHDKAERVVTVSPLLKGEDIGNEENRRLDQLGYEISAMTSGYERAEYLDLRPTFLEQLAHRPVSTYLPPNAFHVALDIVTLRDDADVDARAAERGLHLTLDGIHLNSTGARLVATEFAGTIDRIGREIASVRPQSLRMTP